MKPSKRIVLDANILIRGVLGSQVVTLLEKYDGSVDFYSPGVCFRDAIRHTSALAIRRKFDPAEGLTIFDQLAGFVQVVDQNSVEAFEAMAQKRISAPDPDDWPILAASLWLDCPIWTEDHDFFGTGVATWTTRNIEIYLSGM